MRLIQRLERGNASAKVYYDRDWGEYIVRFYQNGQELPEAEYCADDKDDALGTAGLELERMQE